MGMGWEAVGAVKLREVSEVSEAWRFVLGDLPLILWTPFRHNLSTVHGFRWAEAVIC